MLRSAFWAGAAFFICMGLVLAPRASWADPPKPGATLPGGLSFNTPLKQADRAALGLGEGPTFRLSDLKAGLVLLEVVGVYCPQCHVQAPLFAKLHARLSQNPELKDKVVMLGMAAGATKEEMEYLGDSGVYPYPVAWDPDFVAHKALGEPKTPFTMLLDAKGKVLYAHLGIIEDMDAFHAQIVKLAR